MDDERWRVERLQENSARFIRGLKANGLDTLNTETAVVPVLCGEDDMAFELARRAHERGIFVLPVVSPAVPEGMARLRSTVTAAHTNEQIDRAVEVFADSARAIGVI